MFFRRAVAKVLVMSTLGSVKLSEQKSNHTRFSVQTLIWIPIHNYNKQFLFWYAKVVHDGLRMNLSYL